MIGGDENAAVPFGEGFTDIPLLLLLGDVDFGLVNRGRGGFFPDAVDVFRLVGDIGDVDIQESEADFVQLRFNIFLDRF